jgi:hypothetical protein
MTFYVGQKVVCVDVGSPCGCGSCFDISLTLNAIYTVTRVLSPWGVEGILVAEAAPSKNHIGFRSTRFRPVVERKTDISIFTEMLKPSEIERAKEFIA